MFLDLIEEGILLQQLSLATDKQPEEGSTIRDNANDLEIFIKMVNGQIIALAVEPNDFIKNVKRKIQQSNECPPDRQRLVFAGKKLEEDHTLSDYNVQNGSTLILVQRLRDAPMDAAG